ncbi:response regulator [Aurantibacillus circumpalustris]|uniref:response regulator n=1 Tax=Aurantibacillus circumpalustris TaxID=3036359 RepID=UPI00295AC9DC|nr:response regulator [Aurantibacillus circumpalustris]
MIRNTTLLIVDDSSENLKLLGNSLKKSGYTVLAALNGKQAIALAESKQPDLILLDVMMPETNGFQVCQILKANELTHKIPVIFLTASVEPESIKAGFEAGGADYITKPFNHEELTLRVTNHLNYKREKELLEKKLQGASLMLESISDGALIPVCSLLKNLDTLSKNSYSVAINSTHKNIAFAISNLAKFPFDIDAILKVDNQTHLQSFNLKTSLQTLEKINTTNAKDLNSSFSLVMNEGLYENYLCNTSKLTAAFEHVVYTLNQLSHYNLEVTASLKDRQEVADTILIEFKGLNLKSTESDSTQINPSIKQLALVILNDIFYPIHGKATLTKSSGNSECLSVLISLKIANSTIFETKEDLNQNAYNSLDEKNILVVEDNELNQKLVSTILQTEGANISFASTGKEAIEKATSQNYHLILMDINIPIVSGIEVTRILRDEHKIVTPIIGISGHADKKTFNSCIEAGMNSFLLKPFEITELKGIVFKELKKNETEESSWIDKSHSLADIYTGGLNKYDLTKLIELSNGDQGLITSWTNNFKNLVNKGISEINLIMESKDYSVQNKIFHELNNYTTYFGVELLKEYLKDLPKIQKSSASDEIVEHFKLIEEELISIKDYFIQIESENKIN